MKSNVALEECKLLEKSETDVESVLEIILLHYFDFWDIKLYVMYLYIAKCLRIAKLTKRGKVWFK